jgi:hypothetical protein
MGKGACPSRYHKAVPVQISRARSPCPYQSRVRRCHVVARLGQNPVERGETLAHYPRATDRVRVTCGWHLIQSGILMKRGDEAHLLRLTVQAQFQDAVRGIPKPA